MASDAREVDDLMGIWWCLLPPASERPVVGSWDGKLTRPLRALLAGLRSFDAEQRGLMVDSNAAEDSLLEGFDEPWPGPQSRPRLVFSASSSASSSSTGGDAANTNAVPESSGGTPSLTISLAGAGAGKRDGSGSGGLSLYEAAATGVGVGAVEEEPLALPDGVRLDHVVQVKPLVAAVLDFSARAGAAGVITRHL